MSEMNSKHGVKEGAIFLFLTLYILSLFFILGGAVNFGSTGIFLSIPFIILNLIFYFGIRKFCVDSKFRMFHYSFWAIAIALYLLRVFEVQNPIFYPANGREFVLIDDLCLVEHNYSDKKYAFDLVDSRLSRKECKYSHKTKPKGILLKKGEKYKVFQTKVRTTDIATEYYMILYKTDAGIGQFSSHVDWTGGDPIVWEDTGNQVKQDDLYNPVIKLLGNIMLFPWLFFK